MAATPEKLRQLYQHHQGIATAILTTLTALEGDAVQRKRKGKGGMLQQAISMDHERRNGHTPRPGQNKAAIAKRRAETKAFLAKFSKTEPRNPKSMTGKRAGLGTLLLHGYLTKKDGKYVRTEKPFEP